MKNYFVIGNPIEHSISPEIHNFWFKENNINAHYNKKSLEEDDLENFIKKIKDKEINGANVTIPFKEKIIPFVEKLSDAAREANSVNTIYLSEDNVIGHNTDIEGFYLSLKQESRILKNKTALILGSGGVAPAIIIGLKKLGLKRIVISNRTKERAIKLKDRFRFVEIIDWGETLKADLVINSTSLGLKENDNINLNFKEFESGCFFYDIIYKPKETNFLKRAKSRGFRTQNGLSMFIFQAAKAFQTWHQIEPVINKNLIDFLTND
tara:strand:- start:187 stop:984 length:798 start_codon:yes stop_codon:yes gene_type:complete